jgi:hypothetical protein
VTEHRTTDLDHPPRSGATMKSDDRAAAELAAEGSRSA